MTQGLDPSSHGGRSISSTISVEKPRHVLTIPAWAQWWGLALGCLVLYLTGASGFDLLTDDEIRYAEAGRRMIESGDWILPEYNGYPRYQKPILFYWLQALSQLVFGSNAWAARLPAALAAVGVVMLTARLGAALWGLRAGIWAGLALALSVEMVLLARMAMTDVVLLLFLQGALTCFCLAQIGQSPRVERRLYRWMYLFSALGVLTKGPIAVVLPGAVIIPWLAARRELWQKLRQMRPWEGFIILVAVAGPWYYWVDWHTHGSFTRHFFFEENLGRFTAVVNEHHQPAVFYWLLLVPMTFPWTGFLPGAIRDVTNAPWRAASFSDVARWFFLLQIVVVLGLFSFSQTKVWTYILPLFPALGLLTGRWLANQFDADTVPGMVKPLAWLFAVAAVGVTIAAFVWPRDRLPLELRSDLVMDSLILCLGLFCVFSLAVLRVLYCGSLQRACIVLVAGTGLWCLTACLLFLPSYDRHWNQPLREAASTMRAYSDPKAVVYRMHELGLNFHSGIPIVRQWREGCRGSLETLLSSHEPIFVLCPRKYLSELEGLNFRVWGENPRFVWGANFPREVSSPAVKVESAETTAARCNPGTNCMAGWSNHW